MSGGAWPFLVGGAICLVNSVNERDLSLLTSYAEIIAIVGLQRGIPSKCESLARVDYVPALCTHHSLLLPIEWFGEVFGSRGGRPSALRAPFPDETTNPGTNRAKEPERRERARARHLAKRTKRLSATDISALASMKNVAKCDTWCELQNPANHRVFERKLRPKPLG
ncbi:hypothetical protein LOK49_LG12G03038 [Camellia lanceoleosa]|uniref:Uncharacterized protein n=1 Tax=Camellia lanceoleosa TaxID=1840588 RepID=A0ACC0FV43_9ERIC|nr:hypothetical protein LOK49_LG12G03038 [Camellia lanceoleosa]